MRNTLRSYYKLILCTLDSVRVETKKKVRLFHLFSIKTFQPKHSAKKVQSEHSRFRPDIRTSLFFSFVFYRLRYESIQTDRSII